MPISSKETITVIPLFQVLLLYSAKVLFLPFVVVSHTNGEVVGGGGGFVG